MEHIHWFFSIPKNTTSWRSTLYLRVRAHSWARTSLREEQLYLTFRIYLCLRYHYMSTYTHQMDYINRYECHAIWKLQFKHLPEIEYQVACRFNEIEFSKDILFNSNAMKPNELTRKRCTSNAIPWHQTHSNWMIYWVKSLAFFLNDIRVQFIGIEPIGQASPEHFLIVGERSAIWGTHCVLCTY